MSRHRRSIYVEDALYAQLEVAAGVSGRSTNAEICFALRAYVGAPARKSAVRANRPQREPKLKPRNAQAEALVRVLREGVLANGRPEHLVNTNGWYDPARLLLDRDKRDFAEAGELIAWCQRDSFWRANVLSMDTFRKQYDKLRLQRDRDRPRNAAPSANGANAWAGFAARRLKRPVAEVEALIERLGGSPSIERLAEELAA